MSSKEKMEARGTVIKAPRYNIRVSLGHEVLVELSPYDPRMGRIV